MIELNARGKTLGETYNQMIVNFAEAINGAGENPWLPCKAYNTERFSAFGRMVIEEATRDPMITLCGIHDPRSLQQYVMEILYGILDFEIEKGNWAYTYHDRMVRPVNQVNFVVEELKHDLYSRRAVIAIRTPDDVGSSDPACLQTIQFLYNGESLDMYVLFRSNDFMKATFMNAFALICLGESITSRVGVRLGAYIHTANDMHVYKNDFKMLQDCAKRVLKGDVCTADYCLDWDERMIETISEIAEMVKNLKEDEE